MSHATVFLIVDAGRSDYVREDAMPFLAGLGEEAATGAFESPPGFAQRTVLFTGRYPDTSGKFSAYAFDPGASPFSWVEKLGPLGRLVVPRKVMWPARWAIDQVTGWLTEAHHTDPAWIPPRILPYFRPCEDMQPVHEPGALGAPSIFDVCRNHGLEARYLAHPVSGDDEQVHDTLVRELRQGSSTDLYVAQFSAADERGHDLGPFSPTMQGEVVPEVDARIASVHAALETEYDSWDLFVCGDHGMAPVRRRVDVLEHLDRADARHGEDYVAFVNSTITVLWYLTARGRREVEARLPDVPGTHVLDDADRRALRIPSETRWGDRMLAASRGVLFWPDYFHVVDSTIEGMHGYLDKRDEGLGMALLATSGDRGAPRHVGTRPLVDVLPTLCDLLGVPTPASNEGTSLLEPREAASGPTPDGSKPVWEQR